MITEIAVLTIDPDRYADFENAVAQAAPFFQSAPGCESMALERVVENSAQYRLVVRWKSLEHHTVLFRNSANFQSWRELVGHFFVVAPVVDHSSLVAKYFGSS